MEAVVKADQIKRALQGHNTKSLVKLLRGCICARRSILKSLADGKIGGQAKKNCIKKYKELRKQMEIIIEVYYEKVGRGSRVPPNDAKILKEACIELSTPDERLLQ